MMFRILNLVILITQLARTMPLALDYKENLPALTLHRNSPQLVTLNEGADLNLGVELNETLVIEGNWIRKKTIPPRLVNSTELMKENARTFLYSQDVGNDSALNIIQIKEARPMESGVYVYVAKMTDFVKLFEFKVFVKSKNAIPYIRLVSPDNVELEQNVYPRNEDVTILCLIETDSHIPSNIPVALEYRNTNVSAFGEPDFGSFSQVTGTFETGVKWRMRLTELNNEFKCSNSLQRVFVSKTVNTDHKGVPTIKVTWKKPKNANIIETKNEIYEGDDVKLTWNYMDFERNLTPVNATWMFDQQQQNTSIGSRKKVTKSVYSLNNISPSQSGEYICLSLLHGKVTEYKRKLDVIAIEKPYRLSPIPKYPIALAYNSTVIFNCEMEGVPRPQYIWTKDGNDFQLGNLVKYNYTLELLRVTEKDNGEYVCTAINRAGSKQYNFLVEVHAGYSADESSIISPVRSFLTYHYPLIGGVLLAATLAVVILICLIIKIKRNKNSHILLPTSDTSTDVKFRDISQKLVNNKNHRPSNSDIYYS